MCQLFETDVIDIEDSKIQRIIVVIDVEDVYNVLSTNVNLG